MTQRSAASLSAFVLFASTAAFAQQPPPIPALESVTPMAPVKQNPVIVGRDGTYSAEINGISYWTFNDTAMSKANASGENFFSNSLSASTSLDASNGIYLNKDQVDSSGLPAQFIPFSKGEAHFNYVHDTAHCSVSDCGEGLAIWPGAIVYNPTTKLAVISFGLINRGGPVVGFVGEGTGISVGTVQPNGFLDMRRPPQGDGASQDHTLMWNKEQQSYGPAFILNGYYYAYGGHNQFVTTHERVARVPVAKLLQISAWTYYAGDGVWSFDPKAAVNVLDGGSSGSSFFYDAYLKLFVTVYSANFSDDIFYAVAAAPEGPWSAATLLATGEPGYEGNADYAARTHPEYSPDGGKTEYISYVHDIPGFLAQELPLLKVVFAKP